MTRWPWVTKREFREFAERINKEMSDQQAKADQLADQLQADEDEFDAFVTNTTTFEKQQQTEIDALKAANPGVDFTRLQSIQDSFKQHLDAAKIPDTTTTTATP